MTRNNLTKQICKDFCKSFGFVKESVRNAVIIEGKIYAFTTNHIDNLDIRQYYEDYSGIVVYDMVRKTFSILKQDEFKVTNSVTRITSKGIKAYQVNALKKVA